MGSVIQGLRIRAILVIITYSKPFQFAQGALIRICTHSLLAGNGGKEKNMDTTAWSLGLWFRESTITWKPLCQESCSSCYLDLWLSI